MCTILGYYQNVEKHHFLVYALDDISETFVEIAERREIDSRKGKFSLWYFK